MGLRLVLGDELLSKVECLERWELKGGMIAPSVLLARRPERSQRHWRTLPEEGTSPRISHTSEGGPQSHFLRYDNVLVGTQPGGVALCNITDCYPALRLRATIVD